MPVPGAFGGSSSGGSSGGNPYYGGGGSSSGSGSSFWDDPKDPEVLPQRTILATISKLIFSQNDTQRNKGKKFLEDNESQFTDEELAQYGLVRPKHDDRSLLKKVGGGILSGAEQLGKIAARAGQAELGTVKALGMGIGGGIGAAVGAPGYEDVSLGDVGRTTLDTLVNTGAATVDVSGSHDINLRQAFGLNKDAGPRTGWGRLGVEGADILGQMALDPLSYMGAPGGAQSTKAGLEAFAKGSPGAEQALLREGIPGLKGGAEELEKVIAKSDEIATAGNAGKRGWMQHVPGFRNPEADKWIGPISRVKQNLSAATATERLAKAGVEGVDLSVKGLSGAERASQVAVNNALLRGREGLKFGGETILGKAALKSPFVKAGIMAGEIERPNAALHAALEEHKAATQTYAAAQRSLDEVGQATGSTKAKVAAARAEEAAARAEVDRTFQNVHDLQAAAETHAVDNPAWADYEPKPYFGEGDARTEREVPLGAEDATHYRVTAPTGREIQGNSLDDLKLAFSYETANLGPDMKPVARGDMAAARRTPEQVEAAFKAALDNGEVKAYAAQTPGDISVFHGAKRPIPLDPETGKPQFMPREQIEAAFNMHGPGGYTAQGLETPEVFAGLDQVPGKHFDANGQVPTIYQVTAKDQSVAPKIIDLNTPNPFPENVRAYMRQHLAEGAAEFAKGSDMDKERYAKALRLVDTPDADGDQVFWAFKDALTQSKGATPSSDILRGFNEELYKSGFHAMEYNEPGSLSTGMAQGKVRVILNPRDEADFAEVPWRKAFQTELPTAAGEGPAPIRGEDSYLGARKSANKALEALNPAKAKLARTEGTLNWTDTDAVGETLAGLQERMAKHVSSPKRVQEGKAILKANGEEMNSLIDRIRVAQSKLDERMKGNGPPVLPGDADQAALDAMHKERVRLTDEKAVVQRDIKNAQADRLAGDDLKKLKDEGKKWNDRHNQLLERNDKKRTAIGELMQKTDESIDKWRAEITRLNRYPMQYDREPGRFETQRNLVRGFFNRDPGVKDAHGILSEDALKIEKERNVGTSKHRGNDIVRGFQNLIADAREEDPIIDEEIGTRINNALQTEGGVPALIQEYTREGGRSAAIKLLEVANEEKARVNNGRLELGFLKEDEAHDFDTWLKRRFTPEVQKKVDRFLRGQSAPQRERAQTNIMAELRQGGAAEERGIAKEAISGSKELEDAARQHLAEIGIHIPKDQQIYDTNAVLSVAHSALEFESQKSAKTLLDNLATRYDNRGVPLVTKDREMAKAYGHVLVANLGEEAYAAPEIAGALSEVQAITHNDETLKSLAATMQKVNGIWKAQATVPLIGGAFHARNFETNIILNWMGGLQNPIWYAKANRIQKKIEDASKLLGREGMDLDQIIAKSDKFTEQEKMWVKGAREHNILQIDYIGRGLESGEGLDDKLKASRPTTTQKLRSLVNPTNQDKFLGVRTGRRVGQRIENNARLAHFMWAQNEFGSADVAAQSVKTFLFDYDDLSPAEKQIKKHMIPFYTFMRKNSALIANMMVNDPGKIHRGTMYEGLTKDENAEFLKDKLIPGYQIEANQAPRTFGPKGVVSAMETPWSAASDALKPLVGAAGELPIVNRAVPDNLKNPEGVAGAARDLVNLPGGPIPEAIKFTAGKAYDVDTFTGGQAQREGFKDRVLDLTAIFAPSPGKFDRLQEALRMPGEGMTPSPYQGQERTDRRKAFLMNVLGGFIASGVGPGSTEKDRQGRYYELAAWIEKQNRGLALDDPRRVPTLDELREQGAPIPSGGSSFWG